MWYLTHYTSRNTSGIVLSSHPGCMCTHGVIVKVLHSSKTDEFCHHIVLGLVGLGSGLELRLMLGFPDVE